MRIVTEKSTQQKKIATPNKKRKRAGRPPAPITEFPAPLFEILNEPAQFHEAFDLQMKRHGDTSHGLRRAIVKRGDLIDSSTIRTWRRGVKAPHTADSMKYLTRIERRYRLAPGYFKAKLPNPSHSTHHALIEGVSISEQRRLSWHLPDDFRDRSAAEQREILDWVRRVIISGATDYRRYQAAALRHRYAIRFDIVAGARPGDDATPDDPDMMEGALTAPRQLADEMADLIAFKTDTLTRLGFERNGVWGEETAVQKVEHLGLLFGALAAGPSHAVKGYGVPLADLSFAMLVLPSVWDCYLQWRQRRRGFYTAWEVDMLRVGSALTRAGTGWLRQSRYLVSRLKPVPGLVGERDIAEAHEDWHGVCDRLHRFANLRAREIGRVARIHRDPFEPILAVLESPSPVGEYRKIAEEILRFMPDERRYPVPAAECVRSYLMIRLGLHLGVRQKNLRQLLCRQRGETPTSEKQLTDGKRGELRWSERDNGWEVFIPAVAFKNMNSSFFGNKPFRLLLPDLGNLYSYIDAYLTRHRARLLRGRSDPGTFFIKTMKSTTVSAEYDRTTFYDAWRLITQRYGVYNPYTNRGAIAGLLPHGPHNVRDVLATHVLKATGSYEQASYAIQDTPDMVAKHYGRFLPQDKAALAAQVLNKVWEAA